MDFFSNQHIDWLRPIDSVVKTQCGKLYQVYEFAHDASDDAVMTAWAKHFRNHYCLDSEINRIKVPGLSNKDFLLNYKFPDRSEALGPATRSGDFAEILIADYLRFVRDYFVPPTRYSRKTVRNESVKGTDILAFKSGNTSDQDELLVYEVKAALTKTSENRVQDAVNDSKKDPLRLAESLQAAKERLYDQNDDAGFLRLTRFQDSEEKPFIKKFGAASVLNKLSYSVTTLESVITTDHPNSADLEVLVVFGDDLMTLTHSLYERAAHEA